MGKPFVMARRLAWIAWLLVAVATPGQTFAQASNQPAAVEASPAVEVAAPLSLTEPDSWTTPQGLSSALRVMLLLTVVSLAPAILLMTTCFIRVVVVLGLLRQALGTQQLPPSQVVTSLAIFVTLLVMTPTWTAVYENGVAPYTRGELAMEDAWTAGVGPIRRFMSMQIERSGNSQDVWMFAERIPDFDPNEVTSYDDVPLVALAPAYMLSELKTAFLIGFQIYLPFLVIDLIVATITISMGMLMLPPVLISAPFKLLLFVLIDGWRLVVGSLIASFDVAY